MDKKEWSINYYQKNKKKCKLSNDRHQERCIKSWEGFIPKETKCQICGISIYFNRRDQKTSIHFDHRTEHKPFRHASPNQWLRKHKRTPENETIWKSCDFGMLCRKCNCHLPTQNRKEYIRKVINYVFQE